MLDSTFRDVLDAASDGDPAAQGRLNDLASQGTLDAHLARALAAEDAEWNALVADAVEDAGGDLSLSSLVDGMLDMAGLPTSAHRVDLASQSAAGTVDLANVDMLGLGAPSAPTPRLRDPRLAWRLEEQARLEDPTWSDRTNAEIKAASDLAWSRLRQAEADRDDRAALVDPDGALSMSDFSRKYGIGGHEQAVI